MTIFWWLQSMDIYDEDEEERPFVRPATVAAFGGSLAIVVMVSVRYYYNTLNCPSSKKIYRGVPNPDLPRTECYTNNPRSQTISNVSLRTERPTCYSHPPGLSIDSSTKHCFDDRAGTNSHENDRNQETPPPTITFTTLPCKTNFTLKYILFPSKHSIICK